MPIASFDELTAAADQARPQGSVGAEDVTVLEGLREAADRGWVRPQLTGSRGEIERLAGECGVSLEGMEILDTDEPGSTAVACVRGGRARLLMKGQIATPALLQAML